MTEFDNDQDDSRSALDPRKLIDALRELHNAATPHAYHGTIDIGAYVYAGRVLRDAEAALQEGA